MTDNRRDSGKVNLAVKAAVDDYRLHRRSQPLFLFVHYFDCHFPYRWWDPADPDKNIVWHDGRWWLFGCTSPKGHDVLRLWFAEELSGRWCEHPCSPIVDGDRTAGRPAGRPVIDGGRIYRFAQDCMREYGASVRAFEITRLTPSDYEEHAITASPLATVPGTWNARRMHHIDAHRHEDGWIACVDGDAM